MSGPLPDLAAAPGMTFEQVAAGSTLALVIPPDPAGFRLAVTDRPHDFRLVSPDHGFLTGPGRFTALAGRDGVIDAIRTTPLLEYADDVAALDVLERTIAALDAAGWTRDGSASAARACVEASHSGGGTAGTWHSPRWAANLSLRRIHPARGPLGTRLELTSDLYLVDLRIHLL